MRTLTLLMLLVGCQSRPATPSLRLAVDSLDNPAPPRLQLASARHLLGRIITPTLPAPITWVTVELIAPDGAVHTRRHVPFSSDPSVKLVASPDGVPHPIDVLPAQPVAGGWALDLAFPVGGTNLQRRPHPGTWTLKAVLDASPEVTVQSTIEARALKMIELLYLDDDIVVANKPSGLLVHRGWDNDDDVALFRVRDAVGAQVNVVHRLDRATSGALLFARHRDATTTLCSDFEGGRVEKRYLALVRGQPPEAGVIDHPVPKKELGERVPAVTRFRLVQRSTVDRCSLVEAMPETGRLHQIRRHMKHLNHPLVGDVNYGSGEINRHYRTTYQLHRLALHAHYLAFAHPRTGARVVIRAPMPDDLGAPLAALALPREVT